MLWPDNERWRHETVWLRCVLSLMSRLLVSRLDSPRLVAPVIRPLAEGQGPIGNRSLNPNLSLATMALTNTIVGNNMFGDYAVIARELVVFQQRYLGSGSPFYTTERSTYMTTNELEEWYVNVHRRIEELPSWC